MLNEAFKNKVIEIANHGLTHCVVGKHLPRYFTSVRKYHREFWDWIPVDMHKAHLERSSKILKEWLGSKIDIFVPPGNVYSEDTIDSLNELNFSRINSSKKLDCSYKNLKFIDEKNVFAFHDKEISILGVDWFETILKKFKIDTKHLLGQAYLKNRTHDWTKKRPLEEVLVENSDYLNTTTLKKRLLKEELLEARCYSDICPLRGVTLNRPLLNYLHLDSH